MLSALDTAFGGVTDANGVLDRPKLAKIVFSDPAKLQQLNEITTPYIRRASLDAIHAQSACPIVLYDAPTLFEAGADDFCDKIIAVLAPHDTRVAANHRAGRPDRTKPHAPASTRSRTTCFTAKNAILSSKTTAISICCIGTPMLYTVNSLSNSDFRKGECNMTSEQLFYDKKTGFDRLTDEDKQGIQTYAEGYKKFLDESKTERDAVLEIARMAESKGFRAWTRDDTLRPGDKIYRINRHKGIMLAVIGEKSLAEGVRLTAAHLDAPRVDIRTVPLYEDNGMAFFKTHYYGGIKKYQWTAIPLELRGVVCVCENGEVKRVQVRVGDKPTDPKFVITDLLPHLATEQMTRKATEVIKGEGLNILIGSVPSETVDEKCSEKIKLAIMEHLNREYGMTEADFLSAELWLCPASNAVRHRPGPLVRSARYGQDDRVCSYAGLQPLCSTWTEHPGTDRRLPAGGQGGDRLRTASPVCSPAAFDTFMSDLCRSQDVLLDELLRELVLPVCRRLQRL